MKLTLTKKNVFYKVVKATSSYKYSNQWRAFSEFYK